MVTCKLKNIHADEIRHVIYVEDNNTLDLWL